MRRVFGGRQLGGELVCRKGGPRKKIVDVVYDMRCLIP